MMFCPHEDHDIDVQTIGRCGYCGWDTLNPRPDSIVYSATQACDLCGEVHPT
jgi:hypothetical protein